MTGKKHPKSLRNPKVVAHVEPKDGTVDRETAKKIAKGLKKDVRDALKANEDKPSDEQVGAAMGKATERKEELEKDGKHVHIGVAISGERGEDGESEAYAKGTGEAAKELNEEIDMMEDEDD